MIHKIVKEEIRVPGTLEDSYLETYLLSVPKRWLSSGNMRESTASIRTESRSLAFRQADIWQHLWECSGIQSGLRRSARRME